MTEETAAGRKTDPFEVLLLEQAQLCHEELKISFNSAREWERRYREKSIGYSEMLAHCQRELLNVRQFVEDTSRLAGMAARLRGQNIRVIRAKEGEGASENEGSIPKQSIAAMSNAQEAAE